MITRRMQNLNNWHVFYILILITFFTSLSSGIINPDKADMAWWSGWLQNFSTEMMGAIATFALFELVVGSRNEKKNLIIQMGSKDKVTALNAVEQLRANGWLKDGSLKGAELRKANLQGANLENANLSGAWLWRANLERAYLSFANLSGARLINTNLEHADMRRANLESASLREANLERAYLGAANLSDASLMKANLEGASLREANLKGAELWAVNLKHANMWDVECDEETTLPDRAKWTPDTDWTKFGAVVLDKSAWQAYRKEHGLDKK